jgi:diguanylate cyclase (GGDEF)-like protein
MILPLFDSVLVGRRPTRWQLWYTVGGSAVGFAAPAVLLYLRLQVHPVVSLLTIAQELQSNVHLYAALTLITSAIFALFGVIAGHHVAMLTELSHTDPLTKLHNTRALSARLEAETARASRYHEPLTLILLDMDRLKHLNDRFGHAAGDRALRHVADAISSQLRESDFAARKGGDEFAIIAPATDEVSAWVLARRIRERIIEAGIERDALQVTVSIGMAAKPADGRIDGATLLAQADQALYEAKRQGRNRVASSQRVPAASPRLTRPTTDA